MKKEPRYVNGRILQSKCLHIIITHFQGLSSAIETECDFVDGYVNVVQSVYCYFMKFYNLGM